MSTFNAIVVRNSCLNFFTVLVWDEEKHTPFFLNNKGLLQNYIDKLLAGESMNKEDVSEDKQKVNIRTIKLLYRRVHAARFKTAIVDRKKLHQSFSLSPTQSFLSEEKLNSYIKTSVAKCQKEGLECIGVFFNNREDKKEFYLGVNEKSSKITIDVKNKETGPINLLIIKDNLFDIFLMYPWKSAGDVNREKLLTGDIVYFKQFLLELSQTFFPELGENKEQKRLDWCQKRFIKLLNNDVEGIEIENISIEKGMRLLDAMPKFKEILDKEGSSKLLNIPNFYASNKELDNLYKIIGIKSFAGTSGEELMARILSSKSFKDVGLETPAKLNDFSHIKDTSFQRSCNYTPDSYSAA